MLYSSAVKVTPEPPVSCTQLKSPRLATPTQGRHAELCCSASFIQATLNILMFWSNHTITIQHILNTAQSLRLCQDSATTKDSLSAEFFPCSATMKRLNFACALRKTEIWKNCLVPIKTAHLLQTIQND